jgi:hypothetical protein
MASAFVSGAHWRGPGLGLIFMPCEATRCRNRSLKWRKAHYRRTDEVAVLLARAITCHSWSSPLMLGYGPEALPRSRARRAIDAKSADDIGGCLQ